MRKTNKTRLVIFGSAPLAADLLLLDDDLLHRQASAALFMQAQSLLGLGQKPTARRLLHPVPSRNSSDTFAADLASEFPA